mgnify:CR=1 FL=1
MNKKAKLKIKGIKTDDFVKTSFNCPIELRDRLEQLINEYSEKHTPEEIIRMARKTAAKLNAHRLDLRI